MVLESLINPKRAEKLPWQMFFLGLLYSSIGVIFALWIFQQHTSLLMVAFTAMLSIPLLYTLIKYEENKDKKYRKELKLLKEHSKALIALSYLFLGFLVSFTLWYTLLPNDFSQDLFNNQVSTIKDINNGFTGKAISGSHLPIILNNNFKVLILCIVFSFFFGAGAIFILTWNASVISVAIGNVIKENLSKLGLNYFHAVSLGLLRYLTHGVFEISAYFIGGLAGGIISVAVIRHDIIGKHYKKIFKDFLVLFFIASFVLLLGGLVEVYVTPLFKI